MLARTVLRALRPHAPAWGVSYEDFRLRFFALRMGPPSGRGGMPPRLKALDAHAPWVRTGTSDAMVEVESFVHAFANQRDKVDRARLRRLVGLGSNIGIAGLAHRYPEASLPGLEADAANTAPARRTLERVRAGKVSRYLETPYSEADRERVLRRLGCCTRVVDLEPTWTIGAGN